MPTPFERHIAADATYAPGKYYRYAELTQLLTIWSERFPRFFAVESIGKSYEGRDIWGVTLTNQSTGPAHEKPAYHVDANIHAGEVSGSAVALYMIHWLLANYGVDSRATFILDRLAIYVVPRICVDGAELYLTTPGLLRSSVRPYPEDGADDHDGLRRADLNGDGYITLMRVPDSAGPWKISPMDDRLMVSRAPDEFEGEFFRLYPEGAVVGPADGALATLATPFGLDLNRNFPVQWVPDREQPGAGPYPFSEPETRALANWLLSHLNLSGSQHFHTHSGIIIRPSSFRSDGELPLADARVFQALGALGTQETGYPAVSLWEGFTPEAERRKGGTKNTDLDWVYELLGIYPFTVELWNIYVAAGVPIAEYDFLDRRNLLEEHEILALRWADEHVPGEGFIPWQPFDHPQLGAVEIGGWTLKFTHQNPPGSLLPDLCHRNMLFTLRCALAAPRVRIGALNAMREAQRVWRVRAVIENDGFLPTWVSEQARVAQRARPVTAEIAGEGVRALSGPPKQIIGDLSGRNAEFDTWPGWRGNGNETRKVVEWIVAAPAGTTITVTSNAHTGGVVRSSLVLE